jgi:hypothetical protein
LALLGALVGTSVFSIGFVSHRSHAALGRARQMLHQDTRQGEVPPSDRQAEYARDVVADAQSYLVLAANLLLVVLTLIAAWSARSDQMGADGTVTLVGFCVIELVIVALGFHDHARVRHRMNEELVASIQLEPPRTALWSEVKAGMPRTRPSAHGQRARDR